MNVVALDRVHLGSLAVVFEAIADPGPPGSGEEGMIAVASAEVPEEPKGLGPERVFDRGDVFVGLVLERFRLMRPSSQSTSDGARSEMSVCGHSAVEHQEQVQAELAGGGDMRVRTSSSGDGRDGPGTAAEPIATGVEIGRDGDESLLREPGDEGPGDAEPLLLVLDGDGLGDQVTTTTLPSDRRRDNRRGWSRPGGRGRRRGNVGWCRTRWPIAGRSRPEPVPGPGDVPPGR